MPTAKLAAHTYTTTATEEVVVVTTFPEQPLGARLILQPIDTLGLEVVPSQIIGQDPIIRKKGSSVALTEEAVNKLQEQLKFIPQPAIVVAIGDITIPVKVGDMVKIYLNQCEAEIFVAENKYLLHPERCILTVTKE